MQGGTHFSINSKIQNVITSRELNWLGQMTTQFDVPIDTFWSGRFEIDENDMSAQKKLLFCDVSEMSRFWGNISNFKANHSFVVSEKMKLLM